MRWFTADWHLGDPRYTFDDVLYRPFSSMEEQHDAIFDTLNERVRPEDTLYHLGDVCVDLNAASLLKRIKCRHKVLILGNYDVDTMDKTDALRPYFDEIYEEHLLRLSNGEQVYLNHYPSKAHSEYFSIVGHIHSLWKVQPRMINVGVDAWHFQPVSETRLLASMEAVRRYYDENVFPTSNK